MMLHQPHHDTRPTGLEPAEFIDIPRMDEDLVAPPLLQRLRRQLSCCFDDQAQFAITRWAEEHLAGLVADRDGGVEDLRSVVHGRHDGVLAASDSAR